MDYRMRATVPDKSTVFFGTTEKDMPTSTFLEKDPELAYWALAKRVEDKFEMKPVNPSSIYDEITSKMGLSYKDTLDVLRRAVKSGYFEEVRIQQKK